MFSIKNLIKKKVDDSKPERKIEFFKKQYKEKQKKRLKAQERKQRLKSYIERAGFEVSVQRLNKIFFNTSIIINLIFSALLIYYFSVTYGIGWGTVVASMIILWVLIFVLLLIALWMVFYIAVDLKIFKRKVDIEDVLPDFLQLTASNINAGMTIDRALWYAVRPRFGVLAKEIETVAKETMSGMDLKPALDKFASRYDSMTLKRAISMINEGIEAGGSIGDLINRVALDIQQQKAMFKEMSANVTTYVIFITFATVVAAPFLFALSGILIQVVENLGSSLSGTTSSAQAAGIPISFSGVGVTQTDFKIFAIASLIITSFFSAIMVATIKKGNVKAGMKYIPIFITISLILYVIAQKLGIGLLSSFFTLT
ncbi:type II secretion system F family protein [Candidatus Woesearchaeota archaeon]|nr:type II secretion system F family protein [Candidatus Woesearchaeota archaeon]